MNISVKTFLGGGGDGVGEKIYIYRYGIIFYLNHKSNA